MVRKFYISSVEALTLICRRSEIAPGWLQIYMGSGVPNVTSV
jgi:hypothetical protein